MKIFKNFFYKNCRKIALELLNVFINHNIFFEIIGVINRQVHLIESVFLVYPATKKYALSYAYSYRLSINMWNPWPCGILWQNGKLGLMFAISSTSEQFLDQQNTQNLKQVTERMETIRNLIGVKRKTFAGILPGVLCDKKIIHAAFEADLTATIVHQAVDLVIKEESLDTDILKVVLGAKGFIGRRVIDLLDKSTTYSVDKADGKNGNNWPHHLENKRIILINITVNHALDEYIDLIKPGTLVINEVYPEPSGETLEKLKNKNCICYHVVGANARAFPPFPSAYKGAIPCCAAWPSSDIEVVVKKIN